jgi:hypothetical protein
MSEFVLGVLCTLWLIVTVIILVVVWQLPEVPETATNRWGSEHVNCRCTVIPLSEESDAD